MRNDAQIHDYLMAHPDILVAMEQKAQADQDMADEAASQAAVDRLGAKAFFDPKIAYVSGPANAKTTASSCSTTTVPIAGPRSRR